MAFALLEDLQVLMLRYLVKQEALAVVVAMLATLYLVSATAIVEVSITMGFHSSLVLLPHSASLAIPITY